MSSWITYLLLATVFLASSIFSFYEAHKTKEKQVKQEFLDNWKPKYVVRYKLSSIVAEVCHNSNINKTYESEEKASEHIDKIKELVGCGDDRYLNTYRLAGDCMTLIEIRKHTLIETHYYNYDGWIWESYNFDIDAYEYNN